MMYHHSIMRFRAYEMFPRQIIPVLTTWRENYGFEAGSNFRVLLGHDGVISVDYITF